MKNQKTKIKVQFIDLIICLKCLKRPLKWLLQWGDEYVKDEATKTIKDCCDNEEFGFDDVVDIYKDTTKQDELFAYIYV